jgi:hypothetical protein
MILQRYAIAVLAAITLISATAMNTLACACCSEPGTYYLRTAKPDSYEIDLISQFRFAPKAKLYMTEAGFEMIEGLDTVKKEDEAMEASISDGFDLAAAFTNRRVWKFEFSTPKGQKGSIMLPMPTQMVSFGADIHDSEDHGHGPLLYKEFRFKGNVGTATGFMTAGITRATTYFLVFQGRGRGCNEVGDFRNWRLEVEGPRAGYAFFGKLSSADKPQSE